MKSPQKSVHRNIRGVAIDMTGMTLRGRRVLATGASGFIGGHLYQRLADAGGKVHGTSRHAPRGAKRSIDWVYVDDAVEAFFAAAMTAFCPADILDVGSGTAITVRELVEKLAPMVPDGCAARVRRRQGPAARTSARVQPGHCLVGNRASASKKACSAPSSGIEKN